MAPVLLRKRPRIIIYHQTHHTPDGKPVSLLPLLTQPRLHLTHVIVAAIHLHDLSASNVIFLNNHPPQHDRYKQLWEEVRTLQDAGVKVMAMLGGAAKGSFARLDSNEATFEAYYGHLGNFIRQYDFDGIDLDIEEPMSLAGVIRLIDRLKEDFGSAFLVTMAPVAAALWSGQAILTYAEFSYEALEVMRGGKIAWYNTQFYCGWGDMSNTMHYEATIARGFPIHKIVVGLITNPGNGPGHVPLEWVQSVLSGLCRKYPEFGGVMGWEYFNALPGGTGKPWDWVNCMGHVLCESDTFSTSSVPPIPLASKPLANKASLQADMVDVLTSEAPLPSAFEYIEQD